MLASNFRDLFGYVVGLPLILLGLLARPRFGRIAKGAIVVDRHAAPTLYGLVDRIATALGARPIEVIIVSHDFNAGCSEVGLRRKRVLELGAPLWNALDDAERAAVIGHEIGHLVNGDPARGLIIGSSLRTLEEFDGVLRIPRVRRNTGNPFELIEWMALLLLRGLFRLIRSGIHFVYQLERSHLFRSTQRAEYLADLLAARVASSAAEIACLGRMYLVEPALFAVQKAARDENVDLWAAEREQLRTLNAKEIERIRRVDSKAGTAVDSSHPPTNLRIALLESRPQTEAEVALSEDESKLIESELAPSFRLVQDRLIEWFSS